MDDFYLKNKLAQSFFAFKSVLPHRVDGWKLFSTLSEVYFLFADKEFYRLCTSDVIEEIDSVETYNLHERIKKLFSLTYGKSENGEIEEMIALKGQALQNARKWGLSSGQSISDTEKIDKIVNIAKAGVVPVMYIYGVMLCHGIEVPKDDDKGLHYIGRSAKWNCADSLQFLIARGIDVQDSLDRLYTVAADTPNSAFVALAEQKYGLKAEEHGVARLTDDLCKRGIIASEQINFQMARILESSVLSLHAKRKIAYSENKDMIASAATFPCSLGKWSTCSEDSFEDMCVAKYSEPKLISAVLSNQEFVTSDNHMPICFCSDDGYVLDLYEKKIQAVYPHVNFTRVNAAETGIPEFRHNEDGVFLRGLKGNSANAILVKCKGEIDSDCMDEICAFLQSPKRKLYNLEYGFDIDLSNVVPICFCDRLSLGRLQKQCRVFNLPNLTVQEKKSIVADAVNNAKALYGVSDLTFENGALNMLIGIDAEAAVRIADRIVQSCRGSKTATVSEKQMQSYIAAADKYAGSIGFGRNE